MQTPKGLLNYEGRPWLIEQLERFRDAGGTDAIVVIGGQHAHLYIPWLESARESKGLKIRWVENPDPKRGKFSSYQIGLREALGSFSGSSSGAFISPIDVPMPRMEIWHDMVEATRTAPVWKCVVPVYRESGGHPALLSSAFIEELLKLPVEDPDARLDVQIQLLEPHEVHRIQVHDPEVTLNLNTPEAWSGYVDKKSFSPQISP